MSAGESERLQEARCLVREARRVVFFTGAGLGADAGIPTFRGAGGLWEGARPEEIATPEAFAADPARVWRWYSARRATIARVAPHAGHLAIARYQERHDRTAIVTQNVDGLHQRAGSSEVIELHGNLWNIRCHQCGAEREDLDVGGTPVLERRSAPRCTCGGLERPAVIWFGEGLPAAAWEQAVAGLSRADLVVVVGTSGVVQPAASLVHHARASGAALIEIDPRPVQPGALALSCRAVEGLPAVLG